MSEPTIRVKSCRDDGRCPECGEPRHPNSRGVALRLPCGCEFCLKWPCEVKHLHALLTEALRQRDAMTTVCGEACGRAEALREERDAAIRENTAAMAVLREHLSGEYTDLADAVRNLAQAYVSECGNAEAAIRERDLAQGWLAKQLEDPEFRRLYSQKLEEETRKERERAEKDEALLLKCEAVLDSYAVAWDAAPALLSEIREVLPK